MSINRGKPYQLLVADVARAFEAGAEVTEGEWVTGPDGRRDMDVAIRGRLNDRDVLIVIECKDFNPRTTGKVDIDVVDALDSKRHDLGASAALICGNSGFTSGALRKAKRKRIGLISVLRRGDDRVKAEIHEQAFLRRVRFSEWRFTYHGMEDLALRLPRPAMHLVRFGGRSLDAWLQNRAAILAMSGPSNQRELVAPFWFTHPLEFQCEGKPLFLRGAEVWCAYRTEWLCQTVRLDASLGIYDYLRGRVQLAPGENQYVIGGVNWETAEPCAPPEDQSMLSTGLGPAGSSIALALAVGIDTAESDLPPLEHHVVAE